jgi:hypothetical protein
LGQTLTQASKPVLSLPHERCRSWWARVDLQQPGDHLPGVLAGRNLSLAPVPDAATAVKFGKISGVRIETRMAVST